MHTTKKLEEWIDMYGQKLFDRAFYLLSNREDAEDAVQEVYVAAYSAMDGFQEKVLRLHGLWAFYTIKLQTSTERSIKEIHR